MIELGEAIHEVLTGDTTWAALAGKRCYPVRAPESPTYPLVTYQQISGPRIRAMGSDPGLIMGRVQVESWGRTYAETRNLAAATEGALRRYRGTVKGIVIHDAFLDNEFDRDWGAEMVRSCVQDYLIWYEEE